MQKIIFYNKIQPFLRLHKLIYFHLQYLCQFYKCNINILQIFPVPFRLLSKDQMLEEHRQSDIGVRSNRHHRNHPISSNKYQRKIKSNAYRILVQEQHNVLVKTQNLTKHQSPIVFLNLSDVRVYTQDEFRKMYANATIYM